MLRFTPICEAARSLVDPEHSFMDRVRQVGGAAVAATGTVVNELLHDTAHPVSLPGRQSGLPLADPPLWKGDVKITIDGARALGAFRPAFAGTVAGGVGGDDVSITGNFYLWEDVAWFSPHNEWFARGIAEVEVPIVRPIEYSGLAGADGSRALVIRSAADELAVLRIGRLRGRLDELITARLTM